jgi:hypothetical protein
VLEADSITDFYANAILAAAQACSVRTPPFVSIGSGDCRVEINVAKRLIELGLGNCSLECLGLSPVLVECAAIRVSNEAFQWRY